MRPGVHAHLVHVGDGDAAVDLLARRPEGVVERDAGEGDGCQLALSRIGSHSELVSLSLEAAEHEAFDKITLGKEEEQNDRQRHRCSRGHEQVPCVLMMLRKEARPMATVKL